MSEAKSAVHQLGLEVMKPAKKKFARRKVVTVGLNDCWSCDLADMVYFADKNDGYKYWLVICDCCSRFATVIPIKDKSAVVVLAAFKEAVKQNGGVTPRRIWVDSGKEFYNKLTSKWAADNKIAIYSTFSESKSVVAERLIRTLKRQVWIYFMSENTRRWIDELPKIVNEYNNHIHSSIDMTPTQAKTPAGAAKIMKEQSKISTTTNPGDPTPFHIGDWVRISRQKDVFEKGYAPNWSTEVYKVTGITYSRPVTYHIVDFGDEAITGSFYAEELQHTTKPEVFIIETVLQKKKVKGIKMMLVKWQGYPDKFNKWIPESSTEAI